MTRLNFCSKVKVCNPIEENLNARSDIMLGLRRQIIMLIKYYTIRVIIYKRLYKYSVFFILMNFQRSKIAAKWEETQDKMILEGIKKFGFNWDQIMKFMKKTRSVNSILRRWHSKLKNEHPQVVRTVSQSKLKQNNQKQSFNALGIQKTFNKTKKQQIKKKIQIRQQVSEESEEEQEIQQKVDQKQVPQKKYIWNRQWKEEDDNKLKKLVFVEEMLDLNQLAKNFNVSKQQLIYRWKTYIFAKIRAPIKTKLYKWCEQQDKILRIGFKHQVDWHGQVSLLLPGRTIASIQSRWRRMVISKKVQEAPVIQQVPQFINKHQKRRLFLIKLGKRMARQKQEQKNMIDEKEQKKQQMVLQ